MLARNWTLYPAGCAHMHFSLLCTTTIGKEGSEENIKADKQFLGVLRRLWSWILLQNTALQRLFCNMIMLQGVFPLFMIRFNEEG